MDSTLWIFLGVLAIIFSDIQHVSLQKIEETVDDAEPEEPIFGPPIPLLKRSPGVKYNPQSGRSGGRSRAPSPVKLEAFLELNCVDSEEAWPVLKMLAEHYGDKLELIVHQFPLPYHKNAFLCTQGFYLVLDQKPDQVFDYMEAVLDNREVFLDKATVNKTETQILGDLAEIAERATGSRISKQTFIADIGNYNRYTRFTWKFAARRGVAGTPWFFINGIHMTFNPRRLTNFEDWKEVLDPLFVDVDKESTMGSPGQARATHSRSASGDNGSSGSRSRISGTVLAIVMFTVVFTVASN